MAKPGLAWTRYGAVLMCARKNQAGKFLARCLRPCGQHMNAQNHVANPANRNMSFSDYNYFFTS
jgi:hypothetical protein